MRSSNPRLSGHQGGRKSRSGGNMSGNWQPIDRLDSAVLALEGLVDLVASAPKAQDVQREKLFMLVSLVTDEIKHCAEALRREQ
ncbi:MAG: hypothetical protein E5V21_06320 [Mesorhizobium sp.]|nr:MAG: hypothetical protein E5V21_06320 [Mesorhizobium sp.]